MIFAQSSPYSPGVASEVDYYTAARRNGTSDSDFHKAADTVHRLQVLGTQEACLVAGNISLDLGATFPLELEERLDMFEAAETLWKLSAHTDGPSPISVVYGLKSRFNLINLKSVEWVYGHEQIPPEEVGKSQLKRLRQFGEVVLGIANEQNRAEPVNPEAHRRQQGVLGLSSELIVKWLLERFHMKEGLSESQVVVPGTLSQEGLRNENRDVTNSHFDFGVVMQFDRNEPPELAHKIQVKTDKLSMMFRTGYDDDIAVIATSEHLSIPPKRGRRKQVNVTVVLDELVSEAKGTAQNPEHVSDNLDKRTDLLLDKLEEAA